MCTASVLMNPPLSSSCFLHPPPPYPSLWPERKVLLYFIRFVSQQLCQERGERSLDKLGSFATKTLKIVSNAPGQYLCSFFSNDCVAPAPFLISPFCVWLTELGEKHHPAMRGGGRVGSEIHRTVVELFVTWYPSFPANSSTLDLQFAADLCYKTLAFYLDQLTKSVIRGSLFVRTRKLKPLA